MALRFNEGRACDAVLRVIEAREAGARQRLRFPERERHKHPVELVCNVNEQLYALEHTGIEPFAGHMKIDAEAQRRVQPIVDRVGNLLPQNEEFELQLPLDGLAALQRKQLAATQGALADWVMQVAPTLPVAPITRYLPMSNASVPGVPFAVRLHRMTAIGLPKRLYVNLTVPDLEERRLDRMRKTLRDKCPKLAGWKIECGARTVLILEQNDIQLTNAHLVTEVLLAAEREIAARADEVYLVMTCIDNWFVFPLRLGSISYFEMPIPRAVEFDSAQLLDITAAAER